MVLSLVGFECAVEAFASIVYDSWSCPLNVAQIVS